MAAVEMGDGTAFAEAGRVRRRAARSAGRLETRLRSTVLRIAPEETTFRRRGFYESDPVRQRHLELHGEAFVEGFNTALEEADADRLRAALGRLPAPRRGFAFEGAAMACTLLDLLPLGGRDRLRRLRDGAGQRHRYLIHVGAGWAFARLRRRPWGPLELDPLLRWLVFDGYGFHEAFFKPRRVVRGFARPHGLSASELHVFDQGVGRALWFVDGGDVERIAATIARFDWMRRGDLWSGVGLAACYAGGVAREELAALRRLAHGFAPQLGQGAAFAATARFRAGNVTQETLVGCNELCGMTVVEAVNATDEALGALPALDHPRAYGIWRSLVQCRCREHLEAAA
jgi:hypothetical protein